jgi:parallel beta-helix repeat protein
VGQLHPVTAGKVESLEVTLSDRSCKEHVVRNQRLSVSISTITALALATHLFAGPLSPPLGPVVSTFKTLTEVEPRIAINATNTPGGATATFRITQPGSYYLTGNIAGVAGKHGIEIAASGVTVDLMGFDLAGFVGIGSVDGVSVTALGLSNIAVVNGSVRNWTDDGVDLGAVLARNCRVANVLASGNAGNGIVVTGGTVQNCSAYDNSGVGIVTGNGCTVTQCSAYLNTLSGISTGTGCSVANCSADSNTADGIRALEGSTVTNCSATGNTADGIDTTDGCTVANCSAYDNIGNGIRAFNGSAVTDCTARDNTLDGILCASGCVIRGNTCTRNGSGAGDGAGIHVQASDNRIEGNNCTGADQGIDVDAAGNIIIRNTCSGNTIDWEISANNIYGPIIDRRLSPPTTTTPAVSGGAATGTLGSTDPNANFTY